MLRALCYARLIPLFVVLAALGSVARPANAALWLPGGTPFETHSGPNTELVSLPDGAGGLFLVWVQSGIDVLAQRVNANGDPLWGTSGIQVSSAAGTQNGIRISPDGAGGIVVVWTDTRTDALGDIYAQRIQADGTILWTADGVALTNSVDRQNAPDIVGDGSGGAIATWVVNNTDIAVRAINSSGVPQGAANGTTICAATGNQTVPKIASDGAAGAIVTWQDGRVSPPDVYAARFTSAGAVPWTPDGVAVLANALSQTAPEIVSDGSGGAIIVLVTNTGVPLNASYFVALRLNSSGVHLWSTAGVTVFNLGSLTQSGLRILADGAGGVFVCGVAGGNQLAQRMDLNGSVLWSSAGVTIGTGPPTGMARDGSGNLLVSWNASGVRAQLVSGAGAPQWSSTSSGLQIGTAVGDRVQIAPDGAGGALLAWDDTGADDVYGMRVLAGGNFPFIPPSLDVADLPGDEGGWVRLAVDMNTIDLYPTVPEETGFAVWRRIALPSPFASALSWPDGDLASAIARSRSETVRLTPAAAAAAGFPPGSWETIGFFGSLQTRFYTVAAPTRADYTGSSTVDEVYLVVTHTTTPTVWYVSPPDSGHSIDNLAPGAPQGLAGAFVPSNTVHLTWAANGESDLQNYAIYRGTSSGFTPSASNRLGYATTPSFDDPGFTTSSYYKVSAIDRHGNESAHALLTPVQVTGVVPSGLVPSVAFLAPPSPNPMTTAGVLEYGLSHDGHAQLELLDVAGRQLVTLRDGNETAGTHRVRWDLRDAQGRRVRPGLYWGLLRAEGRSIARRFVVAE